MGLHVVWQNFNELIAKVRELGGTIRRNDEMQRPPDLAIVGAAAILTLVAFGFFILQVMNMKSVPTPSKATGDLMFLGK